MYKRQVLGFIGLHTDAQTARLRVAQVRAGADFKVLLLARGPGFHIAALDLQIGQIAGAALERANRNIQRTEEIDGVLPQAVVPGLRCV